MATKAELEAELAELRRQLAERPETISASDPDLPKDDGENATADTEDAFEKLDLEKEIETLISDVENFPHKQALLFALGVFALGYMVGRNR